MEAWVADPVLIFGWVDVSSHRTQFEGWQWIDGGPRVTFIIILQYFNHLLALLLSFYFLMGRCIQEDPFS
jgi:hypothetical protein